MLYLPQCKGIHCAVSSVPGVASVLMVSWRRDFDQALCLLEFDSEQSSGDTFYILQGFATSVLRAEILIFCSKDGITEFSETFVIIYQTTRRQIPGDRNPPYLPATKLIIL